MTAPTFGTTSDDMLYDGNAMQHDAADDAIDEMIAGAQFTADETPLPDDETNPYDDFLDSERPQYDTPDPSLLSAKRRAPNARKYERKVAGLFSVGVKVTVANPRTMADAATLLMYGPDIAEKAGNLCAVSPRAASIVDMITDQTENPATALMMAAAPAVLQIIRNHEPVVEKDSDKQPRTMKIPFTKRRLRFKVGFRLGRRMRNMTNDPTALTRHVFTDVKIQEALKKQGITVVVQ